MVVKGRHNEVRRWLSGVGTIAAAVNTEVCLPTLVDLIARTACHLMGYEAAGVLLADRDERSLVISGAHGLSREYVARVNAEHTIRLGSGPLAEGPSSRAFRTAEPVAIEDIAADPSFHPWAGLAREYGYRAIAAIPLLVAGAPAGTVNCYRTVTHRFGDDEIALLTTLANQVGIALQTARLRDRERETIADLERLNASLTAQHQLLQQAEEIHQALTAVALRAGGVKAVADALTGLLSRPVLVTDPTGLRLANARHGQRVLQVAPTEPPGDAHCSGLGELTVPDGSGATAWITAPVLLGEELVAWLWVPGRLAELSALDRRALEHGAVVCGLELLRRRTAVDVEWQLRGDVLAELLSGVASATVRARTAALGHDLARAHRVLVARADVLDGDARQPSVVRRLLGVAQTIADRASPRPLVTNWGDCVVVLWPEATPDRVLDPQAAAEAMRQTFRRALGGSTATVVVGQRCTRLEDYRSAVRTARGALGLAQLRKAANRIVTLPDLGVYGLLLQLDDPRELVRFADRMLAPLHDYDARKELSLVRTLRTYLDNELSTRRTAEALYLHPNTVGLRLKKIEELLAVSLAQPEALLHLKAALMAEDVVGSRAQHAVSDGW
jgi:GAF domain-containing protein/PucR-like helix-turn-helix protein/diguanylate cyclase with GGDEF domain